MTERSRVVRIAACAGVLATLMAGAGCSESYGGPKGSTETGNPPVLDSGAVSLVVSENAVHVVGEPGAVTPPEGTVEITVLRTGEKITGTVNPDGSFDVQVDGTLDDVFEVRVVHDRKSSTTITVMRGGAMVGQGDGGMTMSPPSAQCAELDMRAVNGAAMVVASADTACTRDADCDIAQMPSGCGASSCDVRYVSRLGKAQIESGLAQVESIACAGFEALGCESQPSCVVNAAPPACIAGQCKRQGSPSPCDDCDDFELSWTMIGAGTLPADPTGETFTITGCGTLTTQSYDMRTTCSRELPACGAMGPGWKERIDALLADPDVAHAIGEGGTYGEPEEFSGFVYDLTVRGATFRFRDCAGQPNRTCVTPSGMHDLVEYLWDLQQENRCGVNADCASPFDPGPADASIGVFWHDPASRSCLPRIYGGTGGNENRYMTIEDCQEGCPPPADAGDCGPDRAFAADQCLACGLVGGCRAQSNRCLARCGSDADCEDEQNGEVHSLSCSDGLCTVQLFCI